MAVAAGSSNGASIALGILFWALIIIAYWVPTIVVLSRKAPNVGQVVVVNFALGWTFIGWIVALVMALKPKQQPVYLAYPPPGPYGPPPGQPPWQPYGPSGPPQLPPQPGQGYQTRPYEQGGPEGTGNY